MPPSSRSCAAAGWIWRWPGRRGSDPLPVAELAGTALLSADQARYFADLTGRVLASVAHTPTHYLTQIHTMVGLVAAGRGVALVPASATPLKLDGVAFRPLAAPAAEPVRLHAVWRAAPPIPR